MKKIFTLLCFFAHFHICAIAQSTYLPQTIIVAKNKLHLVRSIKGAAHYTDKAHPGWHYHFGQSKSNVLSFILIEKSDSAYKLTASHGNKLTYSKVHRNIIMCDKMPAAAISATVAQTSTITQLPIITYNPGGTYCLYENFSGYVMNQPNWADSIVHLKASILTASKIKLAVWRVAEKYSFANICITTDSNVYNKFKGTLRFMTVITPSWQWYTIAAGGVSYVGAANYMTTYGPNFVFDVNLADSSEYVADAIAHEDFHLFGGIHQGDFNSSCSLTNGYMEAHGSGQTSWGSCIGAPYGANRVVWYFGAANGGTCTTLPYEDDLAVMMAGNGFTYKTKTIGGTIATAKALSVNGSTIADSGIIITNGDKCDYKVVLPTQSNITLNINPGSLNTATNQSACLDVMDRILNSNGNQLYVDSPTAILNTTRVINNLAAGTYYIEVSGKGNANYHTNGNQGTYAYGSLGNFNITGTISASQSSCTTPNVTVSPNNASIPLGASQSITASGATGYLWSTGAITSTIIAQPVINTTYTVVGTVTGGCTASASCTIIINTTPAQCPNAPSVMAVTRPSGQTYYLAYFTDNNSGPYTLTVKNITSGSFITIPNVTIAPVQVTGTSGIEYSVTITNKCGKIGSPGYFKPL